MADQVKIRIPASIAHVRLVRATASALAAQLDFTYDRIMDLHVAIDEVSSRLLATSRPDLGALEFTFHLDGDILQVEAAADAGRREGTVFLTGWSEAILRSVVQHLEIVDGQGPAAVLFRVTRG